MLLLKLQGECVGAIIILPPIGRQAREQAMKGVEVHIEAHKIAVCHFAIINVDFFQVGAGKAD